MEKINNNLIIISATIAVIIGIITFNFFKNDASFGAFLVLVYVAIFYAFSFFTSRAREKKNKKHA